MSLKIDKTTYNIPSENYYKSKNKKTQIILAGSLRSESNHIKRLSKKSYGMTKKWCTYTISRDGKIYQHYDPKYYTDFMVDKEIDKKSISIVLENMGSLFYDDETDKWYNWIMETCTNELVYEKHWKSGRYWESYTEKQFISTIELCKYLSKKYNIILDSLGLNVYESFTKNFQGIVTRSNYDIDYSDLNPQFNFKRFLKEIGINS
jgi:N-acetyl-anhydromuramyl-L-alanine amidase AmpD